MEYNNGKNWGVRIHNWVEEERVRELSLSGDKNGYEKTLQRTLACGNYNPRDQFLTTTRDHLRDPKKQSSGLSTVKQGPRSRLLQAKFIQQAKEEAERLQQQAEEKQSDRFTTTSRETYGSSSTCSASSPFEWCGGDESVEEEMDWDIPVTIYSQRLVEGSFSVSLCNSQNPFARNTGFTNPVEDGTKIHLEGDDGSPFQQNPKRTDDKCRRNKPRMFVGASVAQKELLAQVQTFLSYKHPAVVLETIGSSDDDGYVGFEEVVKILDVLQVPFNHRKKQALAVLLEGCSHRQLARDLLAQNKEEEAVLQRNAEMEEKAAEQKRKEDAYYYRATIVRNKSRLQEEVVFGVPKHLSKQRLAFPSDVPVIKAILRKQGINTTRVLGLEYA